MALLSTFTRSHSSSENAALWTGSKSPRRSGISVYASTSKATVQLNRFLRAKECPYALHKVSQKFPIFYLWNISSLGLIIIVPGSIIPTHAMVLFTLRRWHCNSACNGKRITDSVRLCWCLNFIFDRKTEPERTNKASGICWSAIKWTGQVVTSRRWTIALARGHSSPIKLTESS